MAEEATQTSDRLFVARRGPRDGDGDTIVTASTSLDTGGLGGRSVEGDALNDSLLD